MTNAEWFNSLPPEPAHQTKYEPDNVIRLPKIDRTLPCGWKASDLKLYCRLLLEDSEG
jgi:hypothetical protein